jgi:hypothetical protein
MSLTGWTADGFLVYLALQKGYALQNAMFFFYFMEQSSESCTY